MMFNGRASSPDRFISVVNRSLVDQLFLSVQQENLRHMRRREFFQQQIRSIEEDRDPQFEFLKVLVSILACDVRL